MNLMMPTRREFTAGLGSIIVSFSLDPKLAFTQQAAKLPDSLAENRMLDALDQHQHGWRRDHLSGQG